MENWGMLNMWISAHPGTFSTHLSQVYAFGMFVATTFFVALKFLRRPKCNQS